MTDWVDGILARKSTAQDDGLRAHPPNPPLNGGILEARIQNDVIYNNYQRLLTLYSLQYLHGKININMQFNKKI
jgi:hypothetical protein